MSYYPSTVFRKRLTWRQSTPQDETVDKPGPKFGQATVTSPDTLICWHYRREGVRMRFRNNILLSLFVITALASFRPTAALAQLEQERNWCAGKGAATPELRIDSCTAVIQNGRGSSKQLAMTYKMRGNVFFHQHDYDRAIQDFNQAIQLDSRNSEAFDGRCWAYATVNKLEEALKDCKEAVRLRPNIAPTLGSLGLVYFKLGRFDDAISTYSASLQVNPKSAYSLYGRGTAKLKKGETAAGQADIAASKTIKDVAEEMTGYGVK
jgi:tetratricopeptide (TPR) repeat protein